MNTVFVETFDQKYQQRHLVHSLKSRAHFIPFHPLKSGNMDWLGKMPSDAFAAGASIVGTGATPEGIDQNPPYYEYAFDTAWHSDAQPLESWFAAYGPRRYVFVF